MSNLPEDKRDCAKVSSFPAIHSDVSLAMSLYEYSLIDFSFLLNDVGFCELEVDRRGVVVWDKLILSLIPINRF